MAIYHLYSKRKQEMKVTEWIERRVWWFYDNNRNRQINGESFAFTYLSNFQINEFLFSYCVDGLNMQSLFDQQRNNKLVMLLKAHLRGIQLKMNYTAGERNVEEWGFKSKKTHATTHQITNLKQRKVVSFYKFCWFISISLLFSNLFILCIVCRLAFIIKIMLFFSLHFR